MLYKILCFKCDYVFSVEGYKIIGMDIVKCPKCGEGEKLHRLSPKEILERKV
jgi:ribosomal protein L32